MRAKLARVKAAEEADVASAYRVLLFSGDDLEAVAQKIEVLTGAPVTVAEGEQIRTDLTAAQIEEITGWGEVQWVEAYVPPRLLNDVAVRTNMMNVSNAWTTLGLTGTNQIVAVCDTGLDTGNTNTLHRDFSNKLRVGAGAGSDGQLERYGQPRHARGRFRAGQRVDVHRQIQGRRLSGQTGLPVGAG